MSLTNLFDVPIGYGSRNFGKENPFAGTDYEDMWYNNPYADLYYEPTFWDNIGFSNKAKDTNAEYDRLYNEYIAGIYDLQRENEYNSEKSQVDRMREAGLNADLLGLSGTQSDSMSPPNAGPNPALNGQSPTLNAVSTIADVLGFAVGTFQQISSIKNLSYQNESIESSLFSSIQPQARDFIVNSFAKRLSGKDIGSNEDLKNEFANTYSTPSQRRRARFAFENILKSSDFTSASNAYNAMNANDKAMHDFIGGIMRLSSISNKLRLESDIKYYKHYDSSISAKSKNAQEMLENWRNDFYKKMYDDFKSGSDLAGLILIGATDRLSVLGLGALNSSKKSWFDSDINWNDSFFGGVGKKLGLW